MVPPPIGAGLHHMCVTANAFSFQLFVSRVSRVTLVGQKLNSVRLNVRLEIFLKFNFASCKTDMK